LNAFGRAVKSHVERCVLASRRPQAKIFAKHAILRWSMRSSPVSQKSAARAFLSQRWAQWFEQHCAKLPPEMEALLPADRALASMLKTGEFMFLNSRYQWEGTNPQSVYVLIEVPMMLYEYIIVRHPNWKPNFRPQ
jgi:hypothetical protein